MATESPSRTTGSPSSACASSRQGRRAAVHAEMTAAAEAASERQLAPHVLREYALLADGERGALIGPSGEVAWMCAPHWDADAVFSAPDRRTGQLRHHTRRAFHLGRLLRERVDLAVPLGDGRGDRECREALAFPGDPHRLVLLRRVLAVGAGPGPRSGTWPGASEAPGG